MRYEFICRMCGEMLRSDSKAALVLSAQNHYANIHGLQEESNKKQKRGWDETMILSEIHQVQG